MRYLPPATSPWSSRIEQRHSPKPGKYTAFRQCLRWEFGFTCAFCLLHESDLLLGGVEGWSVMQIEHRIPQSKDPSQRDIYKNCLYICERCNKSRQASPNEGGAGVTLLDPCTFVWAAHFERVGDSVRPRAGDPSAEYTWRSYGLDDPSKLRLREKRRYWMERYAEELVNCTTLEFLLINKAVEYADESDPVITDQRLAHAKALHSMYATLLEKLAEYAAIPISHSTSCRCGTTDYLSLSDVFEEQLVDLATLLGQARKRLFD